MAKRKQQNCMKIICMLLLIELVAARTVTHRRTEIDQNGEKVTTTWSTQEADQDFPADDDEPFQTFMRKGITLRIKPKTTTLRIGGKNVTPEQLLEQAKHTKELELMAVRQLLSTGGHPVKRTNIENGRKHTSTYTLEPDGSIKVKKVEDIDPADVERQFEGILKQQRAKENPDKLSDDWEWAEESQEQEIPKTKPQTKPASEHHTQPQPIAKPAAAHQPQKPASPASNQSKNAKPHSPPPPVQPKKPQQATKPAIVSTTPADDFYDSGPPSFQQHYPQLPKTWDSDLWGKEYDPFDPPDLFGAPKFVEDFPPYDPLRRDEPHHQQTPDAPHATNTYSKIETDKDGNTVHTTYTTGPNEWRRKTIKISKTTGPSEPLDEQPNIIHTQNLPTLEDFLRTQYNKPSRDPTNWSSSTSSTTPTTVLKTINIEDIPPVGIIHLDKPFDEQLLHPIQPNPPQPPLTHSIPTNGGDPHVERTKIRTLTKTVHTNQAPSTADLDPNMLDILRRAGIKPEEVANGKTITKTRVEPDGRIVTTTYRVRPTFGGSGGGGDVGGNYDFSSFARQPPSYGGPLPHESPFAAHNPYERPPHIYSEPQPAKHHGSSHTFGGSDYTPPARNPLVRDREPLEPAEGVEAPEVEPATLNPEHIHPVHEPLPKVNAKPKPKPGAKSAIAEFLAKIGLTVEDLQRQKGGELVKQIVDEDGRVLTAKFVLSVPVDKK